MLRLSENPALLRIIETTVTTLDGLRSAVWHLGVSLYLPLYLCHVSPLQFSSSSPSVKQTLCITLEISLSTCEDSGLSKASWVSKMMFCWDHITVNICRFSYLIQECLYSGPPLSTRDTFQDPQWTPETLDSAKPYIYYVLSYTYIPVMKFNL